MAIEANKQSLHEYCDTSMDALPSIYRDIATMSLPPYSRTQVVGACHPGVFGECFGLSQTPARQAFRASTTPRELLLDELLIIRRIVSRLDAQTSSTPVCSATTPCVQPFISLAVIQAELCVGLGPMQGWLPCGARRGSRFRGGSSRCLDADLRPQPHMGDE